MHIKKYKEKTANLLICLLVLTLFVTLGLGIIKDKKEAEDSTSVSSKYKEEIKPVSEPDNKISETKTDAPLKETTEVTTKDNEATNAVGTTTGNSSRTKVYTGGSGQADSEDVEAPAEVVVPPSEVVVPPTEVVDPPTEVVDPPVEVVDPPVEVVDPPVEVVDPPVEVIDPST